MCGARTTDFDVFYCLFTPARLVTKHRFTFINYHISRPSQCLRSGLSMFVGEIGACSVYLVGALDVYNTMFFSKVENADSYTKAVSTVNDLRNYRSAMFMQYNLTTRTEMRFDIGLIL